MTSWLFGFSAVALVAVGFRFFQQGATLGSCIDYAAASGDPQGLIDHIVQKESNTSNAWDQAISTLWKSYHRALSTQLVVAGAPQCDAKVFQYWLLKIQEVEPELAQEHFSEEFLETYFDAEVASKCGGGCGCG